MNSTVLAVWRTARTLPDLRELTARWIEGDLGEQPAYHGPSDIEDPEMVPVLAALNRAGYMTTGSQAAGVSLGGNGEHWEQLAAVEGFADEGTARRIVVGAAAAGLTSVVHAPPPPWWSPGFRFAQAVTVTWLNGQPYTMFGARLPRRHLRDPHVGYGICHRDAVNAVCSAWQVTVIDRCSCRPGHLWNTLTRTLIGSAS